MRCLASIGGTPCDFNLTATALPFELYDGLDLLAYTRPDYPVGGAPVYPYPGEGKHYYRASLDTSTQTLEVNVFHDAACTSALESFSDPVGVCSNKRMQIGWKRYNCSANA